MEIELLQKIAKNTEHKTSFQIIVSGNETSFNTRFNPKIELDREKVYEIALVNLETYYSFPNIDESNNIFIYSPDNGNSWVSLAKVLGFTGTKYTSGFHESENVVDILRINSILVNIDIISGSYVNGATKNTIYSFFPKVSPRYKIIESPVNLVYLPITLDTIDSLNVSITDQDDHLLNLRNEK